MGGCADAQVLGREGIRFRSCLPLEGRYVRNGFSLGDFCFTVVQVEQTIFPVAHAQLVHIRELTQAMARFDSFDKVVVVAELRFGHGVYQIDAGGVDGACRSMPKFPHSV